MKTACWIIRSSGALLLAAAVMLFLSNWTGGDLAQSKDPLLGIPTRPILWLAASLLLVVAMVCLFGKPAVGTAVWLAWLPTQFWLYQAGLWWSGFHHASFPLGSLPDVFGLTRTGADRMASTLFGCTLAGSLGLLLWFWREWAKGYLKTTCPHCGGHVAFLPQNLGQKIPCPHCHTNLTLRQLGLVKMACFFCQGHIEFPVHAIGEKMPCPHCKMDITLKEPI